MKNKNFIIMPLLLYAFLLLFKYNSAVKLSVLSSISLWFKTLVPFLFPVYLLLDLLINYGLSNYLYKIFKSNKPFLILTSYLLGTPSNAKYIKEFFIRGEISLEEANHLLYFCYSPSPLFILGLTNIKTFILIMTYLYSMNFIIMIFTKNKGKCTFKHNTIKQISFSKCLEESIYKSTKILILILGIVIFYGIIITFLNLYFGDNIILNCALELTNGAYLAGDNIPLLLFTVSFGGLSIHTQIKSILEDTPLKYTNFLIGRIVSSLPIIIYLCFN